MANIEVEQGKLQQLALAVNQLQFAANLLTQSFNELVKAQQQPAPPPANGEANRQQSING